MKCFAHTLNLAAYAGQSEPCISHLLGQMKRVRVFLPLELSSHCCAHVQTETSGAALAQANYQCRYLQNKEARTGAGYFTVMLMKLTLWIAKTSVMLRT